MNKIYNFEDYCAPTLAEQTDDVELPWEGPLRDSVLSVELPENCVSWE